MKVKKSNNNGHIPIFQELGFQEQDQTKLTNVKHQKIGLQANHRIKVQVT